MKSKIEVLPLSVFEEDEAIHDSHAGAFRMPLERIRTKNKKNYILINPITSINSLQYDNTNKLATRNVFIGRAAINFCLIFIIIHKSDYLRECTRVIT